MKNRCHFRILIIEIALVACMLLGSAFAIGVYIGKTRGWPFVKKHKRHWSIGIYTGRSIFSLHPSPNVSNPVLTAEDVTDVPAEFVADPFMIHHDNKWYMFFEVWNGETNQGDIGLARSSDGLNWNYDQIVLDEPFHLSYPHIFEWNNEFYMIPESHEAYSIQLYRAESFPTKWSFERMLIYGKYADTSIFRFDDKWWLFTSKGTDVLHLFYAGNLTGPWVEHAKSPLIKKDANVARPGGRVLVLDGRIVRFTQDCDPTYGNQVRVFEITELSTAGYREEEAPTSPILKGSGIGWNAKGMHHIDLHYTDANNIVACVDGWRPLFLFGLKY